MAAKLNALLEPSLDFDGDEITMFPVNNSGSVSECRYFK